MNNFKKKIVLAKGGKSILLFVLIVIVSYTLSWLINCGIIKLITMCFGLTFKWSIATGIWLIIIILKNIFSTNTKK